MTPKEHNIEKDIIKENERLENENKNLKEAVRSLIEQIRQMLVDAK